MRSMRPGFQTSRIVFIGEATWKDQRLKAWPRGLRPLRCSFASLRMTVSELFHYSTIRHSFVIRHSSFVICLLLAFAASIDSALAEKRAITEKDLWDFVWI